MEYIRRVFPGLRFTFCAFGWSTTGAEECLPAAAAAAVTLHL